MKMKHIVRLCLGLVLMATGCEKVVEFDIEDQEPLVVVNCKAVDGDSVWVEVTMSKFFLSDGEDMPRVTDADCRMWFNGEEVAGAAAGETPTAPWSGPGWYRFDRKVEEGDTLKLKVTVPGHEPVTAQTVVPHKPAITSVDTTTVMDQYGGREMKIRFVLNDPADEHNYYWVRIRRHESEYGYYDYISDEYFTCEDMLLVNQTDVISMIGGMGTTFEGEDLFFTDEKINGQAHNIELSFYNYWLYNYEEGTPGEDDSYAELILEVASLSEDMYRYLMTTRGFNDLDELFGEAVQVYNNIENGVGILGGVSVKQYRLAQYVYQNDYDYITNAK